MGGGGAFACAVALPAAGGAVGAAGWPAAGGAGEGVAAVAAPAGLAGDGGVCAPVAPVSGVGFDCGPVLQAAKRTARSSRFIRSPGYWERGNSRPTDERPACF